MIIPVLRSVKIKSPGKVILFSKTLKALKNNPVETPIDWRYLPSPTTISFPFVVTNMQGEDRYVQTSLMDPPPGWSDAPINHGVVGNSRNMYACHTSQRIMPEFDMGEYNEFLTLQVKLFMDPGYTSPDVTLTVEYFMRHYKSDDPNWNLIAFHDFEIDHEEWCAWHFYEPWSFYSASRVGLPGYGSTQSLYTEHPDQNPQSFQVWSASFNDTNTPIRQTLERSFLDTSALNLSGVWIAFFGNIVDLTKDRFGIVLSCVRGGDKVLYKYNGYEKPSQATKIRFSGVCMFAEDNYWHVDRIAIVYK